MGNSKVRARTGDDSTASYGTTDRVPVNSRAEWTAEPDREPGDEGLEDAAPLEGLEGLSGESGENSAELLVSGDRQCMHITSPGRTAASGPFVGYGGTSRSRNVPGLKQ
ncbi:hypothetical protein NDU88_000494 [Pleurodeles waltl]|uniref:Uncharacterized protein n=1 Tax=Pleurodeles waltl TaxID=8319 RepID=A0AAV7S5F4_PLEWA|nr:hypothetical protein NDU88_000494 [Pleurodeles waltl]